MSRKKVLVLGGNLSRDPAHELVHVPVSRPAILVTVRNAVEDAVFGHACGITVVPILPRRAGGMRAAEGCR